jgi:hypothetical protein
MAERKRRVLETVTGLGVVLQGDVQVAEVIYSLQVTQDETITRTFSGPVVTQGRRNITGHVSVIDGEDDLIDLDSLVLHLEDGRKVRFFAKRGDPLAGKWMIQTSGGFLSEG